MCFLAGSAAHAGCQHTDSKAEDPPQGRCRVPRDQEAAFGEVTQEVDATIPTVVRVSWQPSGEGEQWVWFGQEGEAPRVAPARTADDGRQEAVLLGLKGSTEYRFQVAWQADDETLCTDADTVTTAAIDAALPDLDIDPRDPEAVSGGWLLVPIRDEGGGSGSWATILDEDGDIVWYYPADPVRERLSLDHLAILHNDATRSSMDPSPGSP